MSIETTSASRMSSGVFASSGLFLAVFSVALFCSALLMFLVQPMVAKTLLPALGGTPQVWSTCMVFFQAMLFAGYLHAHFTGKILGIKRQAVVHLALAAGALLLLPFSVAERIATPDASNPIAWLLHVLAVSIGVPVFLISATAPLLQKWIAHTRHPAAADPYFLYVASNFGSLLALIGYPTLVEPLVGLHDQWQAWGAGFAALVLLIVTCAGLFWRDHADAAGTAHPGATAQAGAAVSHRQRLRWVLLSLAPTSLLLGVTSFITTDIAAVPLFWVVPLALFLLTFILVFAKRPPIAHAHALRAQAFVVVLLAIGALLPAVVNLAQWSWMFLHLLGFFLTALVCHGELVRTRPGTAHLTEFYLWLSFGGVLGGVLTALLAPLVFTGLAEYPLALVLACWLRPTELPGATSVRDQRLDWFLPVLLVPIVWGLFALTSAMDGLPPVWRLLFIALAAPAIGIALLSFSPRPLRFGLGLAAVAIGMLLTVNPANRSLGQLTASARSFFGIYKVYRHTELGLNVFVHGSTVHGVQSTDPAKAMRPATYYHPDGPFGQIFRALAPNFGDRAVAIVGLGAGSLSCYGARGSEWTYYEIDPLVEKFARDPRYFTFLRDCPPLTKVVIGDARITLRNAADGSYAFLLVDAFTSDAIPTHLLTREAIAFYRTKLAPGGVLALHISNRYLNLVPVLSRLARDAHMAGRVSEVKAIPDASVLLASPAQVLVLAADEAALASLATDARWLPLPAAAPGKPWSDDYVNIVQALRYFAR